MIALPKDTAETETRIDEKSSPGTRRTDGKNLVWCVEIEKNQPNYQRLTLLTVLPPNYFMFFQTEQPPGPLSFSIVPLFFKEVVRH